MSNQYRRALPDAFLNHPMRLFMRQPPKPEWLDEAPAKGSPFFAYNALPFLIQSAIGIAAYAFLKWIGLGDLGRYLAKSLIDSLS